MPNQDTGPRLVIDPVPGSTHFRWRLEHEGQTLAMGVELHPDGFSATDGAAKTALMILHQLSSNYTRLCRQIRDAPAATSAETSDVAGEMSEVLCTDGAETSDDESEEELSERARLDAEAEAPDEETDDGPAWTARRAQEQAGLKVTS